MKNFLIPKMLGIAFFCVSFTMSTKTASLPEDTNPYRLTTKLANQGIKFKQVTMRIGKGADYGRGDIRHSIKTLEVHLSKSATILKIYPYVTTANTDGGYNAATGVWAQIVNTDLGWLIMKSPQIWQHDNEQIASVEYDNWRDNDEVIGYVIVAYQ